MRRENWWNKTLTDAQRESLPHLKEQISCDVLIVGGGMAGLHAAQRLIDKGRGVVVIEKGTCGSGSTGKSAGFLSPYSDMELYQLARRHGDEHAKMMWQAASEGIQRIVNNIEAYRLDCDLQKQDSAFLALGRRGISSIKEEVSAHNRLGMPFLSLTRKNIEERVASRAYHAGIIYGGTYSFNPLKYIYGLKQYLIKRGVRIYENTEAISVSENTVCTSHGSVTAKHIIFSVDKMKEEISPVAKDVHTVQTFIAVSEPLTAEQERYIFPKGNLMCWDSGVAFSYFRLTADRRILLGGASTMTMFASKDSRSSRVIRSVIRSFRSAFPELKSVLFTHYWPGRLDATKDLTPIIDYDKGNRSIQYVLGCIGLGWAVFCGDYAAGRILDNEKNQYEHYFRIDRRYLIPRWMETIIGRRVAFLISTVYHKFIESAPSKRSPFLHPIDKKVNLIYNRTKCD